MCPSAADQSDVSLEDILFHLTRSESDLTEDEILNGPLDLVEDSLADQGLAAFDHDLSATIEAYQAAAAVHEQAVYQRQSATAGAAHRAAPAALWLPDESAARAEHREQPRVQPSPVEAIARTQLLEDLIKAVHASETGLMVAGRAGMGKSHLVRKALLRHRAFRDSVRRVVEIDCLALRMATAQLFSREAAWACFGRDDDAFKEFLAEFNSTSGGKRRDGHRLPLTVLLRRRLEPGGLVVLDHVEKLGRSGELDSWIADELLPTVKACGARAIFIHRDPCYKRALPSLRDLPRFEVGEVTLADAEVWSDQPALARHRANGLDARNVLRITGGLPCLIRELGEYLSYATHQVGNAAVRGYARWRLSGDRPVMACERLIRAARRHPDVVERAIGAGAFSKPWTVKSLSGDIVDALVGTGAVKVDVDGHLKFSSVLIALRLRRLMKADALACLAMRSDLAALNHGGGWRLMRRFPELAADPIAQCIGHEQNPVVGLTRLTQIIERWGFDPTLYIRDADNARLWAPFLRPAEFGPFESRKQPNFGRAAQTGEVVVGDDGRVFIPMTGNTGMVTLVMVLHFRRDAAPAPMRAIEISRVVGVFKGIRPTVAQVVQRLALRRERKFQEAMLHRQADGAASTYQTVLREAGCQSLVVFERDAQMQEWFVSRFERTSAGMREEMPVRWAEGVDAAGLDRIAFHPTGRGLVLSGPDAEQIFPRLTGERAAVYLHPCRASAGARVVAFLFRGADALVQGHVQTHLSVVAPSLLASA